MTPFEIWLLFTVVPSMDNFFGFLAVMSSFFAVFGSVAVCAMMFDPPHNKSNIPIKRIYIALVVFSFITSVISILLPNKENMALIVGGSYITQLEGAETIPPAVVEAITKTLEKYNNESP